VQVHAAVVRKETLLNTVATMLIAAALSWLLFRGESSVVALAPPVHGVLGIVPGTFNFTLLVTLALTAVIRARTRRGECPRLDRDEPLRWVGWLPTHLLARALTTALLATLLFVPITLASIGWLIRSGNVPEDWSFTSMLVFFVVYFAALSLVVTPTVVWRALAD
jgi:hypothetical protein